MSESIEKELSVPEETPDGDIHQCKKCEFSTQWKSHYNIHMRTHNGERPFKCSQCSYSAGRRETLNRHIVIHSEVKPFICSKCDFSSKRKGDVVRHEKIHTDYKAFKCKNDNCNYSTNRLSNLRVHATKHYKEVTPSINQDTKDNSGINYLVVTQTSNVDVSIKKVFVCGACGFAASTRQSLNKHEKTHFVRLKCTNCDYVTLNKANFARHLKTHEFKFRCNECSYATNYPGQYRTHQLTHTGSTRLFRCSKCSYVSYWKYEVSKHQKTHPLETETFEKYTRLFEKYKHIIKPCIVTAERLTLPVSNFSSNVDKPMDNFKIEIVDASELLISDSDHTNDATTTNFIVIRNRVDLESGQTEKLVESKATELPEIMNAYKDVDFLDGAPEFITCDIMNPAEFIN